VAEAIYISFSKICGRGNLHFLFKDMWQRQSTFPFQRYAAEAIYISFSKTCGRGNLHFLFKDMRQRQSTFPFQRHVAEAIYISSAQDPMSSRVCA
jgi:hypothetical protein